MKCEKCNSENVQIQAKEYKPKLAVPVGLTLGGFGMIFLGIIGFLCGFVVGLIIGAIITALVPTRYDSVMICQDCGHSSIISDKLHR